MQSQPLDPGEFFFVVGDHHVTKRQRLRRNQQVIVIGSDWCARLLQTGSQQSVTRVRRGLKGKTSSAPSTASNWDESRGEPFLSAP